MELLIVFSMMFLAGVAGFGLCRKELQDVENISAEVVGTVIDVTSKDRMVFMAEDGSLFYCEANMGVAAKGKRYRFSSPCIKKGVLYYKDATLA